MDDLQLFRAAMKQKEGKDSTALEGKEPEYIPRNDGEGARLSSRRSFALESAAPAQPPPPPAQTAVSQPLDSFFANPAPSFGQLEKPSQTIADNPSKGQAPVGRSKFSRFFDMEEKALETPGKLENQQMQPASTSETGTLPSLPSAAPMAPFLGQQPLQTTSPRSAILQMINHPSEQLVRPPPTMVPSLPVASAANVPRPPPTILSEHDLLQKFGVETSNLPKQPPPDDFKRVMDMLARTGPSGVGVFFNCRLMQV